MTVFNWPKNVSEQDRAAVARAIAFFQDGYEIHVTRVEAGGYKRYLGDESQICRFCQRTKPAVTFKKNAHAISELLGNGVLLTKSECDECNARFGLLEADLGAFTLAERLAGQVLGKKGVPSAKTTAGFSRIDFKHDQGYVIENNIGDPIAELDAKAKTLKIKGRPQGYRPLAVFKAFTKMAVTLLADEDLPNVSRALRWLRADGLTIDQIDDGTRYTCIKGYTPGLSPFRQTQVLILKRKRADVLGPGIIFVVMFGGTSYQIIVPSPELDARLIGKTITYSSVPLYPFIDQDAVMGLTRQSRVSLASPDLARTAAEVLFNFGSIEPGDAGAES
ncbi:MAG: hypothetical protein ABL957_05075 [Parvularculaceae bacterium]